MKIYVLYGGRNVKKRIAFSILIIAMLVYLPACGENVSVSKDNDTQTTGSPTQSTTVMPTAISVNPTATVGAVQLKTYTHPSNSFSFTYPADWTIEEIGEGDVVCMNADQSGVFSISVINTGYELESGAYGTLVTALETNLWVGYKNYTEVKRETFTEQDSNFIQISKTLDINQIPYQAITTYNQIGQAVYWITMFKTDNITEESANSLVNIFASEKNNQEYVKDLVPYMTSIGILTGPDNLFTMNTPISWTYQHAEDNTGTSDIYTSPDVLSLVVNLYVKGDTALTQKEAEAQSKDLLKSMVGDQVHIASTEVLDDGHTHWNYTFEDSLTGEVFLKPVGNDLEFLMYFYATAYENVFSPVMQSMFGSYAAGQ